MGLRERETNNRSQMEQNLVFRSSMITFLDHNLSGMKESAKFDKEFDRGGCIYEGKVDWTVEKGKCDMSKVDDGDKKFCDDKEMPETGGEGVGTPLAGDCRRLSETEKGTAGTPLARENVRLRLALVECRLLLHDQVNIDSCNWPINEDGGMIDDASRLL